MTEICDYSTVSKGCDGDRVGVICSSRRRSLVSQAKAGECSSDMAD